MFLFRSSHGNEWMTHKRLKSIIRTPWMRACSFQRSVRAHWQLLELQGLCLYLQLSQVPWESVDEGVCIYVRIYPCASVHASRKRLICIDPKVSLHTYIGCLRGLQLGKPSLLKALRSQRHQLSMTSPFPAHQYELIVALLKACKG